RPPRHSGLRCGRSREGRVSRAGGHAARPAPHGGVHVGRQPGVCPENPGRTGGGIRAGIRRRPRLSGGSAPTGAGAGAGYGGACGRAPLPGGTGLARPRPRRAAGRHVRAPAGASGERGENRRGNDRRTGTDGGRARGAEGAGQARRPAAFRRNGAWIMKKRIVVGSRRSRLALAQTRQVLQRWRRRAEEAGVALEFDVREIVTKGDKIVDVSLSKVGGKGLFVKEIEQALLAGEIDVAVHSMKDVPAELPAGLVIGAVPEREDPRDALVSRGGLKLAELPAGSVVGTSSLRRACQLRALRPDLRVEWIRGNIDTRLGRLERGDFDAVLLAAAGLNRLGWADRISERLSADDFVPAAGQGALALECREDDEPLRQLLTFIHDPVAARETAAERAFLARIGGGCQVPVGACARTVREAAGAD